jgi:uncharacterized membrane protein
MHEVDPALGTDARDDLDASWEDRAWREPARSGARDVSDRASTGAIPSVAAVDGHPLHPMLVPLPIGAFALAFAADLAFAATGDRFYARGARLLSGVGVASGLLAGMLGATDFVGRERIRDLRIAWLHGAGNLSVVVLGLLSAMTPREDGSGDRRGALLTSTAATMLLVTGWLGGELSYRHKVGVIER